MVVGVQSDEAHDKIGLFKDSGDSRGPAIELWNGKRLFILDPKPEDIQLNDIAHATSKLCRFTGHTSSFYSVAQHCVLASYYVPEADAGSALLHDAAEAYVGDLSRPLKVIMDGLAPGVYRDVEGRISQVIAEKYGVEYPWPESVKLADHALLATEGRDVMTGTHREVEWAGLPEPYEARISPWQPNTAYTRFLERARELGLQD